MAVEAVMPIFRAAVDASEQHILRMHSQDFGTADAPSVAGASPYMADLVRHISHCRPVPPCSHTSMGTGSPPGACMHACMHCCVKMHCHICWCCGSNPLNAALSSERSTPKTLCGLRDADSRIGRDQRAGLRQSTPQLPNRVEKSIQLSHEKTCRSSGEWLPSARIMRAPW